MEWENQVKSPPTGHFFWYKRFCWLRSTVWMILPSLSFLFHQILLKRRSVVDISILGCVHLKMLSRLAEMQNEDLFKFRFFVFQVAVMVLNSAKRRHGQHLKGKKTHSVSWSNWEKEHFTHDTSPTGQLFPCQRKTTLQCIQVCWCKEGEILTGSRWRSICGSISSSSTSLLLSSHTSLVASEIST